MIRFFSLRLLSLLRLQLLLPLHLSLAALISLQVLQNALNTFGYVAVAFFVMIESSGIPFPGETMLLLASFYVAATTSTHLSLPFIIASAALGAIVGDNIGYTVGRTGGRAIVQRYGHYVGLKPEKLKHADKFFERHGNKTVFFGRFIAVLRAWAAFLAGVNHMRWSTFLLYNAAGGILWATIFGTLGYYAGRLFHNNFGKVQQFAGTISLAIGAVIIVVVLVIVVVMVLRRKAAHQHSS